MAILRSLPTVIAFSAAAAALAVIAALLPSGGTPENVDSFSIEYDSAGNQIVALEEKSIFDFLKFELDPGKIAKEAEIAKIARSQSPIGQQNLTTTEKAALPSVRVPAEMITVVADNSAAILPELQKFVAAELAARTAAVQSGDAGVCGEIGNSVAAENCRGEIYFQKAITARDAGICGEITNLKLRARCQNYLELIFANEKTS